MKRNEKIILVSGLIFLFVVLFLVFNNKNPLSDDLNKICIGNKACFNVEIADNAEKRIVGLSSHEFLEDNASMLFIFEEEIIPGFWMKNMKFSIDIIWIDENKRIASIEKMLFLVKRTTVRFFILLKK